MNSRTFNTKRNIVFGLFGKIVMMFLSFLIKTVVIKELGADYNGLGALFSSILQVLNTAELGFTTAITFRLYEPIAKADTNKICAILNLFRFVYKIIGSVILVAGLICLPFIDKIINNGYPNDINIYVLFVIYLFDTIISYLSFGYCSVILSATQRSDILDNVQTIVITCRCVIQICMLLLFKNYYIFIIWNPICTLICNFVIFVISRKKYPEYRCKGKLEKDEIKEIIQNIKGIIIGRVGTISRNSFDTIVLSMFTSLTVVTIYSNYYYIINSVLGFTTIITRAMTAGVGNSLVIDSKEKNYNDFLKFTYYFSWIGGWCVICLFCLFQPFMKIWMGEGLMVDHRTVLLFCIYFYILQIGQIRSVYTSASGIWWALRKFQIIEAISNLLLNFVLGFLWGIDGVIISTIITVFMCSIIGIGSKTIKLVFQKSIFTYFRILLKYTSVICITCLVTYAICNCIMIDGIKKVVLNFVVCLAVPNIIFLGLSLIDKNSKKKLLEARDMLHIHK